MTVNKSGGGVDGHGPGLGQPLDPPQQVGVGGGSARERLARMRKTERLRYARQACQYEELHARLGAKAETIDLAKMWSDLGVRASNGKITFDDADDKPEQKTSTPKKP